MLTKRRITGIKFISMKKRVHEKLAMYKTVQQVLSANAPAWEGIPAMVGTVQEFNTKVEKLDELGYIHGMATAGTRSTKDLYKSETIDLAERIAGALKSLAGVTGNLELKEALNFSRSKLRFSSNAKTIILIDTIIIKGMAYSTELEAYGISSSDLQELQDRRVTLNGLLPSTRTSIINRMEFTARIDLMVKELDNILKDMIDPQMLVLKKDHPEFFRKYTFSRNIIESASRSTGSEAPSEPDDGI